MKKINFLDWCKANSILLSYLLMFLLLLVGIFDFSGASYFPYLIIYILILVATYLFLDRFFPGKRILDTLDFTNRFRINLKTLALILLLFSIIIPIAHLFKIGYWPAYKSFLSNNSNYISLYRTGISDLSGTFFNYASSFLIKAIFPFLLIYFFLNEQKKNFAIIFAIILFYDVSLIQKSYIVSSLMPLIAYCLFTKRYATFFKFTAILIVSLFLLVFITNPELRTSNIDETVPEGALIENPPAPSFKKVEIKNNAFNSAFYGLYKRMVLVPGEVVSKWFEIIPTELPYTRGCGYRFIAPFKGCKYKNYDSEVYNAIYPEYAKMGIKGSYNTASFMVDYSNFGYVGLLFSGFILAIILYFANLSFSSNYLMGFCLSFYPILSLSSTTYTTLIFSGGWGLTMFLFLIFSKELHIREMR
jgi:hypothetical protein